MIWFDRTDMLFTILYIVMSVNSFDTKLWLVLNSLLDCLVQLKEKKLQISKFVLGFQAQLYVENGWDKYIMMIHISIIYSYICYFSKFEWTSLRECILVEMLHQTYHFISLEIA